MKIGLLFEARPSKVPKGCAPDIYMEFENLETIQKISCILEEIGHTVVLLDATKNVLNQLKKNKEKIDIVFNYSVGFGSRFREILPSATCEVLGLPYTGSDPMAQALAAHKHVAKLIAQNEGITTPLWFLVYTDSDIQFLHNRLEEKYIIKPVYEGSSIGITESSITNDLDNIKKEIEKIRQEYNQPSLMEQFIEGYEITVPVLGTTHPLALSPVGLQINGKLVCGQKIFSSKMKSETNLVSWTTELPFTKPLIDKIKKWSVLIHKTIGCRDLSRVDFRITVDNEPFFLEINSTPQLTPEEGTFAIAGREKNLSYKDILIRVIDSAKERYFFPTPKTKFH